MLRRRRVFNTVLDSSVSFDPEAASQALALWLTGRFEGGTIGRTANNFNSIGGFVGSADSKLTADSDWTVCFWLNFNALGGVLMSKWDWGNSRMVWEVRDVTSQIRFIYTNSSGTQFNLDDGASISTGTWYFVAVGYDSVNNQVFIKRDNNALVTASLSGGLDDIDSPLSIGMELFFDGVSNACNAVMDGIGVWERTLTNTELNDIYNAGSGVTYASLSEAQKISMLAWYNCNDGTGVLTNEHDADLYHLARLDFGTRASQTDGIMPENANLNEPVYDWVDISDTANNASQSTFANRAVLTSGYNGSSAMTSLVFDGANDYYTLSNDLIFTGDFTLSFVNTCSSYASTRTLIGHATLGKIELTSATNVRVTNDAASALNITHGAWDTNPSVVSIARSGSTISVYRNGVLQGTGTLSGTITFLRVGMAAANPWVGNIAEVFAFSGALSASEIHNMERYLGNLYGVTIA